MLVSKGVRYQTRQTMTEREGAVDYRTPQEIAKDFLRPYVARGWSLDLVGYGRLGHNGRDFAAQIGGDVLHRQPDGWFRHVATLKPGELAVTRIGQRNVLARFPLVVIYHAVSREEARGERQVRLF